MATMILIGLNQRLQHQLAQASLACPSTHPIHHILMGEAIWVIEVVAYFKADF